MEISISRVHFLRGTSQLAPMPSSAPPPAQSSLPSILTECLLSVWLCRESPQTSRTLTPHHVPHHPNLPVIPSNRQPSAIRPKYSRACCPSPQAASDAVLAAW